MADSDQIIGGFSLAGPEVLEALFPQSRSLWVSRASTKYAILGPTSASRVGPKNILTLDWVQDAQPFAWVAANPPSLLTLDWVDDAGPFASNDTGITGFGFSIVGTTSLLPRLKSNVWAIQGTTSLTPRVKQSPVSFNIIGTTSLGHMTTRTPKACEFPGAVIEITSNLPFGIWQTNPDAIFTWNLVFVCPRVGEGKIQVDGYVYVLDKVPGTQPDLGNVHTSVPNAEFDLSSAPYGTGSWWFHVAAYDYVGVGPAAHYNVDYNHLPSGPGDLFMRIDGLDTLRQRPLVPYQPPTPHVFTWNISTDLDPNDILNYEIEVSITPDFAENPDSHVSDLVLDVQNVPIGSYTLPNPLDPGVYYWRLRAFDGNQFSQWSPIGSFRINAPPLAPYDLAIYQT